MFPEDPLCVSHVSLLMWVLLVTAAFTIQVCDRPSSFPRDIALLWSQGLGTYDKVATETEGWWACAQWFWRLICALVPCHSRMNFSHLAKRLLQVFQEECVQKYQASLVTHGKRMR